MSSDALAYKLAAFLAATSAAPFVFGEVDCCLWPADWIVQLTGCDPAADLRGTYRGQRPATRLVHGVGGFLAPLWSPRLLAIGLVPVDVARVGDVGLVMTEPGETGAIRVRNGWACKRDGSLMVAPFPQLSAWGLRAG